MTGTAPEPSPFPPPDLAKRKPLEVMLQPTDMLHRFFSSSHDPIYFDRSLDGRLNAPDAGYGVLYAAQAAHGAFAETFLRNPGLTQLPTDLLASYWLRVFLFLAREEQREGAGFEEMQC